MSEFEIMSESNELTNLRKRLARAETPCGPEEHEKGRLALLAHKAEQMRHLEIEMLRDDIAKRQTRLSKLIFEKLTHNHKQTTI